MTQDEFDATRWRAGMKAVYGANVYALVGCNFKERLISLEDDVTYQFWVRCENVQIVGATK